jgi:hypothetical protein
MRSEAVQDLPGWKQVLIAHLNAWTETQQRTTWRRTARGDRIPFPHNSSLNSLTHAPCNTHVKRNNRFLHLSSCSRSSSVSIVIMLRVRQPGLDSRQKRGTSLHHRVQTGSGAHPASYPTGTGGSFPGVKRRGVKLTTHLHLVPRLRMRGDIYPLPLYIFMESCLVKHRDNFTFNLSATKREF